MAVEPVAVEPVAVEPVAVEPVAVEPVAVGTEAVEPKPALADAGVPGERLAESSHLERIEAAIAARGDDPPSGARRSSAWQHRRRGSEMVARRRAVECLRLAVRDGGATKREVAASLGIPTRTLRRWEARDRRSPGAPTLWIPLGRKLVVSPPQMRERVFAAIRSSGPWIGMRTVSSWLDDMPRSEVVDLLARSRRALSLRDPLILHDLEWLRPGAVWAMDCATPPTPVDGIWPVAFSLRDLASGWEILWRPLQDASAETIVPVLGTCFEILGAPLVLKSDLGPAFISEECRRLVGHHQVKHLFSPAHTPPYNGSAEVGIRWQKTRTEAVAAAAGRPDAWSREDMARARSLANDYAPRGQRSHRERWETREPISPELRDAFLATVAREEATAREEAGCPPTGELRPARRRVIERTATRRALVAHGVLQFRRRVIPKPIQLLRADKFA